MQVLSNARPLLLASASPRRREILESVGVPHVVGAVSTDETVRPGEGAAEYLARVVDGKLAAARAVLADGTAGAVLVADTSVIAAGEILGKPVDEADAARMIRLLAGRAHDVATRFAIGDEAGRVLHAETVTTRVTFRALTDERVRAYVATGEGTDKAGAYAVQGRGAALVARIEGSYSNVVGLPACEVVVALERLGLVP